MNTRKALAALKETLIPKLNRGAGNTVLPDTQIGSSGIPKILHQAFSSKDLPPELIENIERFKSMNPGWEHKLYDNATQAKFVEQHFGRAIYERFTRINPRYGAARSDLFRYLLVYKYGGVYLDIKSSTLRPLDDVIRPDDSYVLTNSGREFAACFEELKNTSYGELLQWNIIAAPRHPFLKAVIEAVLRNIDVYSPTLHGVGRYGVFRLTGPIAYSMAIGPLLDYHPHRLCGFDCDYREELGLNYSIFPDHNDHRKLFSTHYALLKEPIIEQNNLRKIRESIFLTSKKIKKALQ